MDRRERKITCTLCAIIQQLHSTPLNKAGNIYQILPYFQSFVEPVSYRKKEAMEDATFPLGLILVAAAAFGPSSRKHLSMH